MAQEREVYFSTGPNDTVWAIINGDTYVLGPTEQVMEEMANFLAEEDFGE